MPLSPQPLELLVKLPKSVRGDLGVFPLNLEGSKSACFRFGIIALGFRDLRHGVASSFFEKGLNVMPVAAIKEHKGLRILQRYTHLRAEDLAL